MDMECEAFLEPLGMTYLLGKLAECGYYTVRDMMSMSDADFANLGVADEDDRQSILFRLSASAGQSEQGARFIHQVNFTALIEATRFAAKGQNRKNKFWEWKKMRELAVEKVGLSTAGAQQDAALRSLFNEIDEDNSALIEEGELRVALSKFGISQSNVSIEKLMEEGDPAGVGGISYDKFCEIIIAVLRS